MAGCGTATLCDTLLGQMSFGASVCRNAVRNRQQSVKDPLKTVASIASFLLSAAASAVQLVTGRKRLDAEKGG